MDEDDKRDMKELRELVADNNRMLRHLYRGLWWSRVWRIFYWSVIIVFALTGYYYAEPYIKDILTMFGNVQDKAEQYVPGGQTGTDSVKQTF